MEVEVYMTLGLTALHRCSVGATIPAFLGLCILYRHDDGLESYLIGGVHYLDPIRPHQAHFMGTNLSALFIKL